MAEGGRNVEEDDVAEWLRRQPRKLFRETGREFKSHRRRGSFSFLLALLPLLRSLLLAACASLVALLLAWLLEYTCIAASHYTSDGARVRVTLERTLMAWRTASPPLVPRARLRS